MIERREMLAALAAVRTNEIVVVTASARKEWFDLSPHGLNLSVDGAVGYASSVGLGLALGLPNHKVIVLDGDGNLIMNLGSLITIANVNPANLVHVVLENGQYELCGNVPTPGFGKYSLVSIARGAGIARAYEFDLLAEFQLRAGSLLREPGPLFVSVRTAPDSVPVPMPFRLGTKATREFEQAIRQLN